MRLHWVSLGLALVAALDSLTGCGARTGLELGDACGPSGSTRLCAGVCGPGLETCAMGYWQKCVIPDTTRACTNTCGAGTQLCTAGAWQSCVVAPTTLACSTICGSGTEPCTDDTPGPCDAPAPHNPILNATFLDFRSTQPDFEGTGIDDPTLNDPGVVRGIVEPQLDSNDLPVYAGNPTTPTTTGKQDFDVWYRPTPGVNQSLQIALPMMPAAGQPGFFSYDNQAFFLLDSEGLGNDGQLHNFDFTMHTESSFIYRGGESFSMMSDDDSWLFLNRQLAIDLGGLHDSQGGTVLLDAVAARLGLVVGTEYPLDVFYAERHVTGAVFGITCTIAPRHQCD